MAESSENVITPKMHPVHTSQGSWDPNPDLYFRIWNEMLHPHVCFQWSTKNVGIIRYLLSLYCYEYFWAPLWCKILAKGHEEMGKKKKAKLLLLWIQPHWVVVSLWRWATYVIISAQHAEAWVPPKQMPESPRPVNSHQLRNLRSARLLCHRNLLPFKDIYKTVTDGGDGVEKQNTGYMSVGCRKHEGRTGLTGKAWGPTSEESPQGITNQ